MLKYPRLLRLICCLAMFQVVAPSMVAVADAWRMDKREAYLHIESETSSGCAVVHHDDCALCAFISVCGAPPPLKDPWPSNRVIENVASEHVDRPLAFIARATRQRAPPVA